MADPAQAQMAQRFFKTGKGEYGAGDKFLGLRVPQLHALAREYRELNGAALLSLLRSPWHEERVLALLIMVGRYQRGTPALRAALHRTYLRNLRYVNNWDLVDCSAPVLMSAPAPAVRRALLLRLAASRQLWHRRVAMLATFADLRAGEYALTLRLARVLRDDPHDLIHKAVGWMLRELGKRDRSELEAHLRRHASRMPRTMLRYAIERLPPRTRRAWLAAPKTTTPRAPRRAAIKRAQ